MSEVNRMKEKITKIEVVYQDVSDGLHVVEPGMTDSNAHVRQFGDLSRKLTFISRWLYKKRFEKAHKQKRTFPDRVQHEYNKKTSNILNKKKDIQ